MADRSWPSFTQADSLEAVLRARRDGAAVLAGGTWLMREPRRGGTLPVRVVTISGIAHLAEVSVGVDEVLVGAAVTHAALADALRGLAGLEALAAAAEGAANPAIRRMATVGGNLCASGFSAADLVPALLALDAQVELAGETGTSWLDMERFVRERDECLKSAFVTRVRVPRAALASVHVRLPLRRAGDYPVAIVSLARMPDRGVRIAVGSVERDARRWRALEEALGEWTGGDALALASRHNDFTGRESIEAEGWYRREVLPVLAVRALKALASESTRP
ncbi:FAD binding domain-containing protein [Aureimonas sp. ME7]|uniref:FAD binding domain-containing protein n=1 Tax=Aureimonas sp. ME7 TaxID=2744252 RepID=UPI001FCEA3CC|nr:FAD binding domain-containing protein [Aureimonas sp. ME7]